MIARIFRISLIILLLFLTWISTGFLKLVQENGVSFSKFEEYIANADVGGGTGIGIGIGTGTGTGEGGFEDGVGAAGPGPGEGPGEGPGTGPGGDNE